MIQDNLKQIGLGGGCHWCTEAVFASLIGVQKVEQGWIASTFPNNAFSEAVVVTYNPEIITLKDLIEIHLHTHSSTANHSMRYKYRSAIYWFDDYDQENIKISLVQLQSDFSQQLITLTLPYISFKENIPEQLNYYYADPQKPFCQVYINPKIQLLRNRFSHLTNNQDGDNQI